MLELFAPPPSQGTSGAYAQKQPNLTEIRYAQDELAWPLADGSGSGRAATRRSTVVRDADMLWRMEGKEKQVLVGILASTEHLTVGKIRLLPGQHTEVQAHGGDESLYVLEGTVNVRLRDVDGPQLVRAVPARWLLPAGRGASTSTTT